jgi:Tol biopolymer transport system component
VTAISVHDRLGRFEILGALGAGGMGEVYRARDPQLARDVAIKVLSQELSGDPVRQQRLEQEARAAAALNHPNIVAIHDFGVHDGRAFIVTELLHGETLRQCLRERVLPPRTAVAYAIQIASGLAAGHDRGIVHRDIKPENVFLTRDGVVKILDFGLAQGTEPESRTSETATITIHEGQVGSLTGTAIYMSPEQARGRRGDQRSDIFSLGSVLYEMLAGRAPFRRATMADTLSAILSEEPQELRSVANVPPALERIVHHCLEKKLEDRFQNARDLIFDLRAVSDNAGTDAATPRRRLLATVGALVMAALIIASGAALVGYLVGASGGVPTSPFRGYDVRRLTEIPGIEESPAISPDGRAVAFTASVDGTRQIFVRLLSGGAPLPVTKDAADHQQPRWSPDGNSLVYFSASGGDTSEGAVWAVPALGGSARRILSCISGADVSKSARVTCFQLTGGKLQLMTAALDGSDARIVGSWPGGLYRYPRWSPDERWIAFQRGDGVRDDVFIVPTNGGEPKPLTTDRSVISGFGWLPSSDGIVYASSRGNTVPYLPALRLWEVKLDGTAARPITAGDASYEQPDVHATGLVVAARVQMRFEIWRFPFDTSARDNVRRAQRVTHQTGQVLTPTSSPDGKEIAFLADHGGRANLWVLATDTGESRQITFERDPTVAVGVPVWSPDGQSIAFVSSKGNTGLVFGLWLVSPDGSNLRNVAKLGLGVSWSQDGKWAYYTDTSAGSLKKVSASGHDTVVVRQEPARNVIGHHGSTLYYMVERRLIDGRPEFEIRAASPEDGPSHVLGRIPPSRVAPWQVLNPALSPDGQWLALPLTDGFVTNIWTLSTSTGEWRQVTDFGDRPTFIARRVSWSPSGRFLLAAVGEGDADVVVLDQTK